MEFCRRSYRGSGRQIKGKNETEYSIKGREGKREKVGEKPNRNTRAFILV